MYKNVISKEKIDEYVKMFSNAVNPEKIGSEFVKALSKGDTDSAVRAAAEYFRNKKLPCIKTFKPEKYSIEIAERGVKGMMREINIDYNFPGGKIDFLFNPTLDKPPVNHEWLWQLNRFYWWNDMAGAYDDTKDEKFACAFEEQLLGWVEQTEPHPTNYNWAGSAWRTIESGLRLMGSWPCAFYAFRSSPSVSDIAIVIMAASMYRQAVHLKNHPTGANWLLMETNGVYTFASLFPEFYESEELRKWAGETISKELKLQILPDGFQRELSPDYHLVSFICGSGVLKTAKACGFTDELPKEYEDYLKKMAVCYIALSTPALVQPRTNDCYTMETRKITEDAENMFPEMEEFEYITSRRERGFAPKGETASRFLPWAGFAAMRSDWGADASYLCFDVGPLGAGHIHQDKLNINIWKGGQELVFDDGGGQYENSPGRAYGVSAYDHNTVTVDGIGQVRNKPNVSYEPIDAGWISNENFDYAAAEYTDGFGQQGNCIAVHKREVRFCKPDFFVVRDTLDSSDGNAHTYSARFHMDTCDVHKCEVCGDAFYADFGKKWDLVAVSITDDGETPAKARTVSGQTEPCMLGWYIGRNDKSNHPATTLLFDAEPAPRRHFTTLFFPVRKGGEMPSVKVEGSVIYADYNGKNFRIDTQRLDK